MHQNNNWYSLIEEFIKNQLFNKLQNLQKNLQKKIKEAKKDKLPDDFKSKLLDHLNDLENCIKTHKKTDDISLVDLEKYYFLINEKIKNTLNLKDDKSKSITYESSRQYIIHFLTHLADNRQKIYHATHIAKMTHSSSESDSIMDQIKEEKEGFLTTSSLGSIDLDVHYPDATYSPYAKFLTLKNDNQYLCNVLNDDTWEELLGQFINQEDWCAINWSQLPTSSITAPKIKSSARGKQIYFPVQNSYHILNILHSSSLIQEVYKRFFSKEKKTENNKIFKQKEEGKGKPKYHQDLYVSFPKIIYFSTVASQPQNVSLLSSERSGNIRLLNSSPPTWATGEIKLPLKMKSIFQDYKLYASFNDDIIDLQKILFRLFKNNINFKKPSELEKIKNTVAVICEKIIEYSLGFYQLTPGWSDSNKIELPIYEKILLDFKRNDEYFIQLKQSDWQKDLVDYFVTWFNLKISPKKESSFSLTEDHMRIWKEVFSDVLREHVDVLKHGYQETESIQGVGA